MRNFASKPERFVMNKSNWKSRERQVARFFGTKRTPLSGGNSGHTRSDILHDVLFIEVKQRPKHSAVTLWDETATLAEVEEKIPAVALCEKYRKGCWLLVHSSDLLAVANQREIAKRGGAE